MINTSSQIPFCTRFHLTLYFKALLRANKNNCIHVEESAERAVISVYKSACSKRPSRTKYRLYFVVDLRASCSRWCRAMLYCEIFLEVLYVETMRQSFNLNLFSSVYRYVILRIHNKKISLHVFCINMNKNENKNGIVFILFILYF